jgi:hypothetical protein
MKSTNSLVPGAPENPAARITGGRIGITQREMKRIFDIVIDKAVTLVKGQVSGIDGASWEKNVSAIVLVGGFAESKYLAKCIRADPTIKNTGIPVIVSPNA